MLKLEEFSYSSVCCIILPFTICLSLSLFIFRFLCLFRTVCVCLWADGILIKYSGVYVNLYAHMLSRPPYVECNP